MVREANARIKSVSLYIEDSGQLAFLISFDFGWGAGGFGPYTLDVKNQATGEWMPDGKAFLAIKQILETLGVRAWEKLPNTYCRVMIDGNLPVKIGHIMKHEWFSMREWMEVKDA